MYYFRFVLTFLICIKSCAEFVALSIEVIFISLLGYLNPWKKYVFVTLMLNNMFLRIILLTCSKPIKMISAHCWVIYKALERNVTFLRVFSLTCELTTRSPTTCNKQVHCVLMQMSLDCTTANAVLKSVFHCSLTDWYVIFKILWLILPILPHSSALLVSMHNKLGPLSIRESLFAKCSCYIDYNFFFSLYLGFFGWFQYMPLMQ